VGFIRGARKETIFGKSGRRVDKQKAPRMPKPITLYGIKACDTMKKARTWLDAKGVAYDFHDYKAVGASPDLLAAWAQRVGWEVLLNRSGTTFRGLPDADKTGLDQAKAIGLMTAQPSMIKRPVLDLGDRLLVGFKPDQYEAALG
jgi:arsenate reductase